MGEEVSERDLALLKQLKPATNLILSQDDKYPAVENCVINAKLLCDVDLYAVLRNFACLEYKQKKFAALICRIWYPKTTLLLFANGNLVCVGSTHIEATRLAIQIYRKMISSTGVKTDIKGLVLSNLVSNFKVNGRIDLVKLNRTQSGTVYEPKDFPGLIWRVNVSDLTMDTNTKEVMVLVFVEGGVVSMGIRTIAERDKALQHILPAIYACRDLRTGSSTRSDAYTRRIEAVAAAESDSFYAAAATESANAEQNTQKRKRMLESSAAQKLLNIKAGFKAVPVKRSRCRTSSSSSPYSPAPKRRMLDSLQRSRLRQLGVEATRIQELDAALRTPTPVMLSKSQCSNLQELDVAATHIQDIDNALQKEMKSQRVRAKHQPRPRRSIKLLAKPPPIPME